ncbi:MAG: purine phosphoribosyltransferase family protein, partial [Treponema lecithinolyticum]
MDVTILDRSLRRIPDFPKPGILFYDITGVLVNPEAFRFCIDAMVDIYRDMKIDAVAGVESRGFIFAAPFADRMGIPLVLVRKKGKLPGDT